MEATVTQAETDFASYAKLSESDQKALEQALASIPDDILSTGDRQWIESRIRNHLQKQGILDTGGGVLGMGEIPAVAFVGRALACLAANYSTLQGISNNQPADKVATSMARTVTGCVSGDADAIKADILRYRSQIGRALEALRLPALRAALLAGDSAG
ncbi:MAG: hypothetical protein ABR608_06265 [Pseudonocardiaceae bacterium]